MEEDDIPTDMDGLLQWCLLSFLKLEAKNIEYPLKTNLLYGSVRGLIVNLLYYCSYLCNLNIILYCFRNYLTALCPPDRTLEIKKSSYKKFGKFLEVMQQVEYLFMH